MSEIFNPDIPTPTDCLDLMTAYGMLPNIREHSLTVAAVARWLGQALHDAGVILDLELIEAGALLHDLGKTACLGTDRNHADWGARLVEDLGLPEVAAIVREHVVLAPAPPPRPIREAEVVHYADKRVLHVGIVSVAERFADLQVRYGRTPEARRRLRVLEADTLALEWQIFADLPVRPDDALTINHCWRES